MLKKIMFVLSELANLRKIINECFDPTRVLTEMFVFVALGVNGYMQF